MNPERKRHQWMPRHTRDGENSRRAARLMLLAVLGLAACKPADEPAATRREGLSARGAAAPQSSQAPRATDPVTRPESGPEALAEIVADAAQARDYATLAAHMADGFSYSFGHEPSREGGLEAFRAEPERLDLLVDILGRDCARDTLAGKHWYICPGAAADEQQDYYGWRAGFRQRADGRWEFVWFIAGD